MKIDKAPTFEIKKRLNIEEIMYVQQKIKVDILFSIIAEKIYINIRPLYILKIFRSYFIKYRIFSSFIVVFRNKFRI